MNIREYREFIVAKLNELEAQHGNIPVVGWNQSGRMLSEYSPTMVEVQVEGYFLEKYQGPCIPVVIIGP